MGKRQHQKDKMYLTYTEWTTLYGGKRSGTSTEEDTSFKRLPFDHCCLCLQPFDEPYCDLDGNVFEIQAIVGFVKKFKNNPVTGKKLDMKSLIKLNFHKNSEGDYHCPVLFKPLTKNSHIVAIRTSGNVYTYEAVEELNIKGKNWKDLIDDTPFIRSDIITIQDPNNLGKFNISTFYHVKNNLKVETEEEIAMRKDPHARLKTVSMETRDILQQLEKEYKAPEKKEDKKEVADKFNAAHYSTGMVAASFTSTAMVPETVHEAAIICEDEVIYDKVKKKGYVRLMTNYGPLNFELYCEVTPKTCHNFITHCNNGYYNGTKFHRSIRNFMIQGGDPTGTGLGGESVWKKPFEDEFRPNLHHTGRGILSMANSGPNTNGSQFFITFRSCKQLDGKHTIFGKLVGGLDTLNLIEQIEVDNKDRPVHDVVIDAAQVFVDPFTEAEEQVQQSRVSRSKPPAIYVTSEWVVIEQSEESSASSPSREDSWSPQKSPAKRQLSGQRSHSQSPAKRQLSGQRSHSQSPAKRQLSGQRSHSQSPAKRQLRGQRSHSQSPAKRQLSGQRSHSQSPAERQRSCQLSRSRSPPKLQRCPRVNSRSPDETRNRHSHERRLGSRSRGIRSQSARHKLNRNRSPLELGRSSYNRVERDRYPQSRFTGSIAPRSRSPRSRKSRWSPRSRSPRTKSRSRSPRNIAPRSRAPRSRSSSPRYKVKCSSSQRLRKRSRSPRSEQRHSRSHEFKRKRTISNQGTRSPSLSGSDNDRSNSTGKSRTPSSHQSIKKLGKSMTDNPKFPAINKNIAEININQGTISTHVVNSSSSTTLSLNNLCVPDSSSNVPLPENSDSNFPYKEEICHPVPLLVPPVPSVPPLPSQPVRETPIEPPPKKCYTDLLTEMIYKKTVRSETLEVYYYSKMLLLSQCEMVDKAAIKCLISGIEDHNLRTWLEVNEFTEPENVLKFFKYVDLQAKSVDNEHNCVCLNCHKPGHPFFTCPFPQIKCSKCAFRGHMADNCPNNTFPHVDITCSSCNSKGHSASSCLKIKLKCTICNSTDHANIDCANTMETSLEVVNVPVATSSQLAIFCNNCGQGDHEAEACPMPIWKCSKCNFFGHTDAYCPRDDVHRTIYNNPISSLQFGPANNFNNLYSQLGYNNDVNIPQTISDTSNLVQSLPVPTKSQISICYNCGQRGHQVKKCPMPIQKCSNCYWFGHTDVNCPTNNYMFNMLEQCKICKSFDHSKIDCPLKEVCFNCGQTGHFAVACSEEKLKCTKCNLLGHFDIDCPKNACFNCGQTGHFAVACSEKKIKCTKCNLFGHSDIDCPNASQGDSNNAPNSCSLSSRKRITALSTCLNCYERGHVRADCPYETEQQNISYCKKCKTTHNSLLNCYTVACFICYKVGHPTFKCRKSKRCINCDSPYHLFADCMSSLKYCQMCVMYGHTIVYCPLTTCKICEEMGHHSQICPRKSKSMLAKMGIFKDEKNYNILVCFICGQKGHRRCHNIVKRLFCESCSFNGHKYPNCPSFNDVFCVICKKNGHPGSACLKRTRICKICGDGYHAGVVCKDIASKANLAKKLKTTTLPNSSENDIPWGKDPPITKNDDVVIKTIPEDDDGTNDVHENCEEKIISSKRESVNKDKSKQSTLARIALKVLQQNLF